MGIGGHWGVLVGLDWEKNSIQMITYDLHMREIGTSPTGSLSLSVQGLGSVQHGKREGNGRVINEDEDEDEDEDKDAKDEDEDERRGVGMRMGVWMNVGSRELKNLITIGINNLNRYPI